MMNKIIINDWKEFNQIVENIFAKSSDLSIGCHQFRGQSDFVWKLEPSLTRIVIGDEISEKKALYFEQQATIHFRSQVHLLDDKIVYNPESNPISVLIDMQHYSCPTRLLDWTTSPYVALYFAVSENLNKNGALFVWDLPQYKMNWKKLHNENSVDLNKILDFNKYNFADIIFSTRKNERLVKQQGTLAVSNNILKSHCEIIEDIAVKTKQDLGLYKLEIPKEKKLEFLARLKTMNITSESLFPGLDGLGRTIKESLILRKWMKS